MKLAVGLGNPGIEYQFTWHNLGFLLVDRLAERHGTRISNRRGRALTGKIMVGSEPVILAKPETFMNLSGLSVRELVDELEIDPQSDLLVMYDELDLPSGAIRVRERGGSAGHNGLESIIGALGTQDFSRLRMGIAPEYPVRDGAEYVLAQIAKSQYEAVDQMLDTAAEAVEMILKEGPSTAMNRYNRRDKPGEQGTPPNGGKIDEK